MTTQSQGRIKPREEGGNEEGNFVVNLVVYVVRILLLKETSLRFSSA